MGYHQAGGRGAGIATAPLRVGWLWELGRRCSWPLPLPSTLEHSLAPQSVRPARPPLRWGPPISMVSGPPCPPLHTHMKALHTHLHPHGPLHTLMLLCSQSSSAPAPHPPRSSADPSHSSFCFTFFTLSSSCSSRSSQSLSGQWATSAFPLTCLSWPHVAMLRVVPSLCLMNTR